MAPYQKGGERDLPLLDRETSLSKILSTFYITSLKNIYLKVTISPHSLFNILNKY